MSAYDLILLVLVAAGAFYAGYQVGRFKALAERGGTSAGDSSPLPGPSLDRPYGEAEALPSRRRGTGTPPPATAGAGNDDGPGSSGTPTWRTPPRRSTKPPPAAAGLMSRGTAEKPDAGQK